MSLTEIFTNIANSIRAKTGKTDTITPSEMSAEIDSISGGEEPPAEGEINAMEWCPIYEPYTITTENATYFENRKGINKKSYEIQFSDCAKLKKVIFNFEGIGSIRMQNMFINCPNLEEIQFKGMKKFYAPTGSEPIAFNVASLKTVIVDELIELPIADIYYAGMFRDVGIEHISFPKITNIIPGRIIYNNKINNLKEITFGSVGNPVTSITNEALVYKDAGVTVNIYVSNPADWAETTIKYNQNLTLNWLQA